jgi:hypothetical protein
MTKEELTPAQHPPHLHHVCWVDVLECCVRDGRLDGLLEEEPNVAQQRIARVIKRNGLAICNTTFRYITLH